jgi:hypothetical protein
MSNIFQEVLTNARAAEEKYLGPKYSQNIKDYAQAQLDIMRKRFADMYQKYYKNNPDEFIKESRFSLDEQVSSKSADASADEKGVNKEGEIDAASRDMAISGLQHRGFIVISIIEQGKKKEIEEDC